MLAWACRDGSVTASSARRRSTSSAGSGSEPLGSSSNSLSGTESARPSGEKSPTHKLESELSLEGEKQDSGKLARNSSNESILLTPQGQVAWIEPKYPFNRLAILGEDCPTKPESENAADGQPDSVVVVTQRRLPHVSSYASSQTGDSLHASASKRSSLSGMDSRRSFQPSSSFGSSGDPEGTLRGSQLSTNNLTDDPIDEEKEVSQQSVAAIPEIPPISSWNDFEHADVSNHGAASRRSLSSALSQTRAAAELSAGKVKDLRRFSIGDPFAHFRCTKKRKNCSTMCRWDIFPGIRLSDTKAVNLLPQDGSSPHVSKQQLDVVGKGSERSNSAPDPTQGGSPRGPLSVDLSESGTSRSGMDVELARTFDLQDLEAAEHSTSESSDNWAPGPQSTQGSQAQQSQQSKAASAPAVPSSPMYAPIERSTTSPDMGREASIPVRDTSKLRVERFKGITFVNEYALVRTLGKGSFGKVKLGLNTFDHQLYALKLIPKSRRRRRGATGGGPQFAESDVLQEITVMKELSHPNVVRLAEVIDDPLNSKMLMVLEYVEGGSLFAGTKISPKKKLTELSARKYFRDVLKGLDYLHANKIAHGDLKPDNLLLGANGHVKIGDFGSSQLTRVCDLVNRTAGTPAFMAPEMCTGQPYHARLADVWALGVCLYMFIYGTVPFKSNSILGLYDQICNTPLHFPSNRFVSDSLKHLLLRLLDKDPDNRITLTSTMTHNWVTHNGAYPLPNIQGLEPDEEEDPASLLMECWPDDPADIGLESVLKTISPLFEQRLYPDGTWLAAQGDPAKCIFFVEEGRVDIYHTMRGTEMADSDDDDESTDGEGQERTKRQRLKRQGSMLKTMFCATVRASRLVSAVRDYAGGDRALLASRGPGSFIGEVQVYEKGAQAYWQTCVRANGDVKVLVLYYKDLLDLITKRPEAAGDVRAVMAQRKGELLKMEMLEKLAGLHRDLKEEVQLASMAGGGSLSAIAAARELLGCKKTEADDEAESAFDHTACNGRPEEETSAEERTRKIEADLARASAPESLTQVEQSQRSFEAKGDSAKTLSLYPGGKTPSHTPSQSSELPQSPFSSEDAPPLKCT